MTDNTGGQTSEEQTATQPDNQPDNITMDPRQLFNLGANLLVAGFLRQKPEAAKNPFKELKQGKCVHAGHLNAETSSVKLPIKLALDRSEFRGQFNFPNFDACLRALVEQFQIKVRQDKELRNL